MRNPIEFLWYRLRHSNPLSQDIPNTLDTIATKPEIPSEHKTVYDNRKILLRSSRSKTRLVHILPGQWGEAIRCELQVISLDTKPVYEALSYVWGNPQAAVPIILNGVVFQVAANLGAALRRLRRTNEIRVIWIDALCINQMDNEEKNAQVRMMGRIFENCVNCIIWLGEQEDPKALEVSERPLPWLSDSTQDLEGLMDDSRVATDPIFAAFVIIFMISKDMHTKETPCFAQLDNGKIGLNPRLVLGLQGLKLIINNSWWTRMWTVQEAILPPNCTVVFGALYAPWEMIASAENTMSKHYHRSCCESLFLEDSLYSILFEYSQNIINLQWLRSRWKNGQYTPFFHQLVSCSGRKATNGLDMVFALVGLIHPGSVDSVIVPDYGMTIRELYSKVAFHFITLDKTWALERCSVNEGGLPSWVIDWTYLSTQMENRAIASSRALRGNMIPAYKLGQAPSFAKLLGHDSLHLRGSKVGTIKSCSREIDMIGRTEQAVPTREEVIHLMGLEWTMQSPYPDGGIWAEAYWRTLIGDVIKKDESDYRRASPEFKDVYWNWFCHYMTGSDEFEFGAIKKEDARRFLNSATAMLHDRRFFVTESGYLGTGPLEMLPGDEVYVLAGAHIPFVLRGCTKERSEASALVGPQFTLVGGCYMHGIMFGELKIREEDYQDIVLV